MGPSSLLITPLRRWADSLEPVAHTLLAIFFHQVRLATVLRHLASRFIVVWKNVPL